MNDIYQSKWRRHRNNTLHHYKRKLRWKTKEFNKIFPLQKYFGPLIGDKKEVNIADVGAGMFCTIGSTWPGVIVHVFPSDALSFEFNQILSDAKVTPIIPVPYENMEDLSYKDNFFDIVNCCNALDHVADPIRALKELYRVVKPGGFIYLRHFPNVGEHEKYHGLHMWNIDIDENGRCIIWNKEENYILNDIYKNIHSVKKAELDYEPNDMIISVIQKL